MRKTTESGVKITPQIEKEMKALRRGARKAIARAKKFPPKQAD